METKLYVGNLPYRATEDDLRNLFEQAGTVTSVTLIKDRETGRSRGFAFVEMGSPSEAQKAISLLNNAPLQDRPLTVNLARPREGGDRRGGQRGSGERGRGAPRGDDWYRR
jgi:RNA recognition motif-containing protein